MSQDPQLFQPPATYPKPPKDMYYQVPITLPTGERPKAIFPWETNQLKPIRVFAEDLSPPPPEEVPSVTTDDDDTQAETLTPSTPLIQINSPEPFASYSRTNAWDEMPEIERYISNLPQNRRAKPNVLTNTSTSEEDPLLSGVGNPPTGRRRPSIKLTDFPTEIERPSLPVTPAPIRRPSFWGEERDAAGDLPGAEGVPEQSEWDPAAKLVELQRRQSEVLAQGPTSSSRVIPNRQLPGSAVPVPMHEEAPVLPAFAQLNFSGTMVLRAAEDEALLSPIETTG